MVKSKPKAATQPHAQLDGEQVEQIASGLAWTLSRHETDLEGLFLLAKELEENCRDWVHVDVIANTLQRHLLIFTAEFDEAEKRLAARLRAGGAQ